MPMTARFALFAAIAATGGWASPHVVHRLGYKMMAIYLALAGFTALIGLFRRAR